MYKLKNFFLLLILPFILLTSVFADVYVKGHTKSNGTYVPSYYRSSPDGNPYNNYSFPGNTNPYTGETAGGSESTYLNNYYDTSTYLPGLYISPYTGSSATSRVDVVGGYKSYGVLFCNSGYYKSGDNCLLAPANSTAYGSYSFYCNTGYQKNSLGNLCLGKDDSCRENHGYGTYYDDSTLKCQCKTGFKIGADRSKCIEEIRCSDYEILHNGSCISQDNACSNSYGTYSLAIPGTKKGNDVSCRCATGYEWTSDKKSCFLSTVRPVSTTQTQVNNNEVVSGATYSSISFDRDLKLGQRGDDVKLLQKVLQFLGFLSKDTLVTGYFGKATKTALKNFQSDNGLSPTGILNDDTKIALITKAVG